jgi:hypothetical protein
LIASIGEDHLNEGKQSPCFFVEDEGGAITILNAGVMNGHI